MKLSIYFQKVTPESALLGDFSDQGLQAEILDVLVTDVIEILQVRGILEPSASNFHPNIWYTSHDAIQCYTTCEMTYYTAHIEDATVEEQQQIYQAVLQKKVA